MSFFRHYQNVVGLISDSLAVTANRFLQPKHSASSTTLLPKSTWRDDVFFGTCFMSVYPNYAQHITHHKHFRPPHTYGCSKQTRFRVVDNSKLGREAMAEGKYAKCINVYSHKWSHRPHGAKGVLGDRILVAIKGLKRRGIVVGLTANQKPGIPKFDSNNMVLLDDNGNPLGTRIIAPIPHCIRPTLVKNSHPKKADYTKILAIATKFV